MSRRTERVGSAIKQELATVILHELDDPRLEGLLPSINRVKVSEDLATADVYVVMMGSEGKQNAGLAALKHAGGMMRSKVASALNTRTTPFLRFHLDNAYREEMKVLDLIRQAEQEFTPGEDASDEPSGALGEADRVEEQE
ncbi:MAG: 30S ribosome-binding factor RbfA [Planctomycetota bacterium]